MSLRCKSCRAAIKTITMPLTSFTFQEIFMTAATYSTATIADTPMRQLVCATQGESHCRHCQRKQTISPSLIPEVREGRWALSKHDFMPHTPHGESPTLPYHPSPSGPISCPSHSRALSLHNQLTPSLHRHSLLFPPRSVWCTIFPSLQKVKHPIPL